MNRLLLAFFSALILPAATAHAQRHPDHTLYEYAVEDYRGNIPEPAERTHWECWDDGLKISISCALVRGRLQKVRYVFRSKGAPKKEDFGRCDRISLEIDLLHYDEAKLVQRSRRQLDAQGGTRTNCEREANHKRFLSLYKRYRAKYKEGQNSGCGDYSMADIEGDIEYTQRRVNDSKHLCQEELQAVEREERAAAQSTSGSGHSELYAVDQIACFGGCQPQHNLPRGTDSTITGREFGDNPGPDVPSGATSAR